MLSPLNENIRESATTTWHYSCSCKMGPEDDSVSNSAVNPRLKVRKVEGLRVVDASVMPFVISANTCATSMMIGDKAAEMILEDHELEIPSVVHFSPVCASGKCKSFSINLFLFCVCVCFFFVSLY